MDVNQILSLITEHGMGVVLMAYFLLKDWKWNAQITSTLNEVKQVLAAIKTILPVKKDDE